MRSSVFMPRGLLGGTAPALALAATAAPAVAQEGWELVRHAIQEVGKAYEAEGYSPAEEIYEGLLSPGASDTASIELIAGKSYQFLGACDVDCSDLDLFVYGPDGVEIGNDFEPDNVPRVRIIAPRSGTYQVRATMIACTRPPCYFGIGTFVR